MEDNFKKKLRNYRGQETLPKWYSTKFKLP